jgi:TFIIF-interacting CTD phosphatase-like protein
MRSSTVTENNRINAKNPKVVSSSIILPPQSSDKKGKKTLILDLDETLVHSAFKPFNQRSDILLNVELDKKIHVIHVLKRPGAEEFIERMSKHYEVIIFTASLSPVSFNFIFLSLKYIYSYIIVC